MVAIDQPSVVITQQQQPAPYQRVIQPDSSSNVRVTVQVAEQTYPSFIIPNPSYVEPIEQPIVYERPLPSVILPSISIQTPIRQIIQTPQPSYLTQSPSGYTCSLNYQINTNIHIYNICTLSSPSSSIFDSTASNSLFTDNGYSFESHHYPFQTIVISLKFTGYVQSLSLGSQSNVQRYGLRMFNPSRNVDDTYYSSIDPITGQPIISNIHMSKVAIRLYINLYTTRDGRPPSNIQLNFNICFDLRSSSAGDEGLVIQGTPIRASPIMTPERIVPPIPIRVRVPESVPIILTIPTTIIKQPDTYDAIDTVPSEIIGDDIPQQPVRIPSVPSIVASIEVDSDVEP
ncbi:unnamed protein product, partial [Adineta steineri]